MPTVAHPSCRVFCRSRSQKCKHVYPLQSVPCFVCTCALGFATGCAGLCVGIGVSDEGIDKSNAANYARNGVDARVDSSLPYNNKLVPAARCRRARLFRILVPRILARHDLARAVKRRGAWWEPTPPSLRDADGGPARCRGFLRVLGSRTVPKRVEEDLEAVVDGRLVQKPKHGVVARHSWPVFLLPVPLVFTPSRAKPHRPRGSAERGSLN